MKNILFLSMLFLMGSINACPFIFINDSHQEVLIFDAKKRTQTCVPAGGDVNIIGAVAEINL